MILGKTYLGSTETQRIYLGSNIVYQVSTGGWVENPVNLTTAPTGIADSAWVKGYISVEDAAFTDPFGGTSAILYRNWNTVNTTIRQTLALSAGVVYTAEWYAYKGTTTDMRWGLKTTTNVDIIPSTSFIEQTTQDAWELVTVTFTVPTDNNYYFFPALDFNNGVANQTFAYWGVQLYASRILTESGDTLITEDNNNLVI